MGIPSYFSYLIKKTSNFSCHYSKYKINHLFFDSNSIIYDCYYKIINNSKNSNNQTNEINHKNQNIEDEIKKRVLKKFKWYIDILKPTGHIYIAFDGIPPMAKVKQQFIRRFKSGFDKKILNKKNENNETFDTNLITPGTKFMNELMVFLKNEFQNLKKNIIFDGSDNFGEGEHKIFNYIKKQKQIKNFKEKDKYFIYGLDADLIMLSLNCKNSFLIRELPDYISKNKTDEERLMIYDIPYLSELINEKMNLDMKNQKKNNIQNYLFLCFLLGNDFIPHYPFLSIRDNGIEYLISKYLVLNNEIINDDGIIDWKVFRNFISKIIIDEKFLKDKYISSLNSKVKFDIDKLSYLENIDELFILEDKKLYYKMNDIHNKEDLKNMCVEYLKNLEWCWKYYNGKKVPLDYVYKYNYSPYFRDLIHFIPFYNHSFFETNYNIIYGNEYMNSKDLLQFVIPKSSEEIVKEVFNENEILKFQEKYDNFEYDFKFTEHLWQSKIN